MSILVGAQTRLLVQGITGREGEFHSRAMLDYGTNVVAGVTPGKGGQTAVDGRVPVYDTVVEAVAQAGADAACIFVPAPFASVPSTTRATLRRLRDLSIDTGELVAVATVPAQIDERRVTVLAASPLDLADANDRRVVVSLAGRSTAG